MRPVGALLQQAAALLAGEILDGSVAPPSSTARGWTSGRTMPTFCGSLPAAFQAAIASISAAAASRAAGRAAAGSSARASKSSRGAGRAAGGPTGGSSAKGASSAPSARAAPADKEQGAEQKGAEQGRKGSGLDFMGLSPRSWAVDGRPSFVQEAPRSTTG